MKLAKKELAELAKQIRACRLCRLSKSRKNAVPGEGPADAKLFFVGQAPGRKEDESGKPFVGMAGKFLDKLLAKVGIARGEVFITSAVKCFPPKNRKPRADELAACLPYLKAQLEAINPRLIILLGEIAVTELLGKKLSEVAGKVTKKEGRNFFATFHPAAGMRFPKIRKRMEEDFRKIALISREDS
ncbi:MAG: uracil-DNA glycosylase [Candidatus Micrarchaeia archaeon]